MSTQSAHIATREGLYRCTGLGETKFFNSGELLAPGGCPGCQDGSAIWLYSLNDDQDKEDLLQVSIDLDRFPTGLYLHVDDLFLPDDFLNIFVNMDLEVASLVDGYYRVIDGKEEGNSFHFWAEGFGHNYFYPGATLYEARTHPD